MACMSAFDCANQCFTGPASVEPRKYRYLPLASKTGSIASARPSVTADDLSVCERVDVDRAVRGLVAERVGHPLRVRRPGRLQPPESARAVARLEATFVTLPSARSIQ